MVGIGLRSLPSRRPVTCRAAQRNNEAVTIRFSIPFHCRFGQHMRVVGSCESLGNWELERALAMNWNEGDVWSAEVQLPADKALTVEYKYVVCEGNGANAGAWKPGSNFVISVPGGGNGSVKVKDAWDDANREVQIETIKNAAGGRKGEKGNSEGDAVAAISATATSALEQLEAAVNMSLELLEISGDVASPDMLAADRLVAAAAQRAATMTKALDVASTQRLGSEEARKQ